MNKTSQDSFGRRANEAALHHFRQSVLLFCFAPREGKKDYETPRPMSVAEIKATVADCRQAAVYGHQAGFDGIEVHSANGYLLNLAAHVEGFSPKIYGRAGRGSRPSFPLEPSAGTLFPDPGRSGCCCAGS